MDAQDKDIEQILPLIPDILSPTDDYIFKLIFGHEDGVERLTSLLQSVLKLSHDEYSEISITDPHLLREYKDDKLGILDIKVKTKSGKIINIEIQVEPSPVLRERILYYTAKMITGQMKSGNDHSDIKRVISIVITAHNFIDESKEYHNRFTLYDPETKTGFSEKLEIHTIELPKIPTDSDGTQLWWWTKFLSAKSKEEFTMLAEQNPQVKNAVVRLMELSSDEKTRLVYESRHKMAWDNWGRERAAEEKGMEKGIEKGRTEIIERLKLLGLSDDIIRQATELPPLQ
ncbi:MAG: Rpn family recombination-promoting nuclease/putative transposase [Oscillospiraceae bacterium]|nr:Rpn family recombination-promoting nuclease/putative transposase [Oscillospiraceae bacterium]